MNPNSSNYIQTVPPETGYSAEKRRLHENLLSPATIKRQGNGLLDLCKETSPNNFLGKL